MHFRIFDVEYRRTERDTDVILSLLESTRARLSYGILLEQVLQKNVLRYHDKSYAVESALMIRNQITFHNDNISWTFGDIVENVRKKIMASSVIYDVMIAIMR